MKTITTIGLDIAKSVFQVHGIDAAGKVVIRKQLKRGHEFTHLGGGRRNNRRLKNRPRRHLVEKG